MNTRIYFDKLPDTVTENELMDLFSAHGNVVNLHLAADRTGFVTMITPEGARAAIQSLNGRLLGSATLILGEVPQRGEHDGSLHGPSSPRRRASHLY